MGSPYPLQLGVYPSALPLALNPCGGLETANPTPSYLFASGTLCSGENLPDFLLSSREGNLSATASCEWEFSVTLTFTYSWLSRSDLSPI